MTGNEVYNRHRALYSFKTLMAKFQTKSIELLDIRMPSISTNQTFSNIVSSPGSLMYNKERKCLMVQCSNNTFIEVHRLRVEGRKAMTALDFNNGFLKKLQKCEMEFQYNKSAACC